MPFQEARDKDITWDRDAAPSERLEQILKSFASGEWPSEATPLDEQHYHHKIKELFSDRILTQKPIPPEKPLKPHAADLYKIELTAYYEDQKELFESFLLTQEHEGKDVELSQLDRIYPKYKSLIPSLSPSENLIGDDLLIYQTDLSAWRAGTYPGDKALNQHKKAAHEKHLTIWYAHAMPPLRHEYEGKSTKEYQAALKEFYNASQPLFSLWVRSAHSLKKYPIVLEGWVKHTKPQLAVHFTPIQLEQYKQDVCSWYESYANNVFQQTLYLYPELSLQNLGSAMRSAFKPLVSLFYADPHLTEVRHAVFDAIRNKVKTGDQVVTSSVRRVAAIFLQALYWADASWQEWKDRQQWLFLSDQNKKTRLPELWRVHPLAKLAEYFPPSEQIFWRLQGVQAEKKYLRGQLTESLEALKRNISVGFPTQLVTTPVSDVEQKKMHYANICELLVCAQLRDDFKRLNRQTGVGGLFNKKRAASARDIYAEFVEVFLAVSDGKLADETLQSIFSKGNITKNEWRYLNLSLAARPDGGNDTEHNLLKQNNYTAKWLSEFEQDVKNHEKNVEASRLTPRKKLTLLCLFEPGIRDALLGLAPDESVIARYLQTLTDTDEPASNERTFEELMAKASEKNKRLKPSERIATSLELLKHLAFSIPFEREGEGLENLVEKLEKEFKYIATWILYFYENEKAMHASLSRELVDFQSAQQNSEPSACQIFQEKAFQLLEMRRQFKEFCKQLLNKKMPGIAASLPSKDSILELKSIALDLKSEEIQFSLFFQNNVITNEPIMLNAEELEDDALNLTPDELTRPISQTLGYQSPGHHPQ